MAQLYQKFCKESIQNNLLTDFKPIYKPNFNFAYDVVDELARISPQRRAMLWCNDKQEEHTFSFEEISRYSTMAANLFLKAGIQSGDTVLLILKRHYQFWFALLGLHKIGAIAIPSTHLLTSKDLIYRFQEANVKAILCTAEGETIKSAETAIEQCPSIKIKFTVRGNRDGWRDFDQELKQQNTKLDRIQTKATDPMLLYFTSGTTGMPKMVYHNFSYPIAHIITAKYWQGVIPDGLHFTLSDTGWMKAMWGKLYGQWFMEAGIFVYDFDQFVPSKLLPLFHKYQITTFCAPPTVDRFFLNEGLSQYDLSSLTHVCIAGEPLNPEVFHQFYQATGLKLMEGFGQTETTLLIFHPIGSEAKPGSMGKPSPAYHIDLIDKNGNSVEPGMVGEIVIKTDDGKPCGMFDGYYKNPDLTKNACKQNIYHTGDTARKDEEGYFWYVGRIDDIIKSSGYRIGPFEIENVLMEHPAVHECAITGEPDPLRGQVVKATIVLAKGYSPSDSLKKQLQEYVKKQTAPYKYPRMIEFTSELPKTINGKIKRSCISRT